MSNLQARNIPEGFHERLRRHARERNCTMSAAVLEAIERDLARWEWSKHIATRPTTAMEIDAVSLIAEARELRDTDLA